MMGLRRSRPRSVPAPPAGALQGVAIQRSCAHGQNCGIIENYLLIINLLLDYIDVICKECGSILLNSVFFLESELYFTRSGLSSNNNQ